MAWTRSGVPGPALDRLSMTLGGQVVPIWLEVAILVAFGLALLVVALLNFRHQD